MKTKIFYIEQDDFNKIIEYSSNIIQQGGLVVFPTETVYGIGANALNKNATSSIYKVKGRPSDNPLIIHIADKKDVFKYAKDISDDSLKLMNKFWPGPLTIVFNKKDIVPTEITGGLDTVAIRYPKNKIAEALIQMSNLPICAPSANISGTPSSTTFEHVYKDLNTKVDVIIDGGKSYVGLESTVLDMTSDSPTILRPGAVTKSMIEKILLKEVLEPSSFIKDDSIPKSPGMKYKHYAPKGEVILLESSQDKIIDFIQTQPSSVGFIGSSEVVNQITIKNKISLGSIWNYDEIAQNIFSALREMDEKNIPLIYIEAFEEKEIGMAIMNRLTKAANFNIKRL